MSHMAIENDPSARIQRRSRGELQLPGSCYVCGNGNVDEGYLDYGTFVDYHGNFYLCVTCAAQGAELIGYLSPEAVEAINRALLARTEELEETKKELADARQHITTVNNLLNSRFAPGNNASANAPKQQPDSGPPSGPFTGSKDRESEAKESDSSPKRSRTNGSATRNVTLE